MAEEAPHTLVVDCFARTEARVPMTAEEVAWRERQDAKLQAERDATADQISAAEEIRQQAAEDPNASIPAGLVARAMGLRFE